MHEFPTSTPKVGRCSEAAASLVPEPFPYLNESRVSVHASSSVEEADDEENLVESEDVGEMVQRDTDAHG